MANHPNRSKRNPNYRKSGPGRFHNMAGPVVEVDGSGQPTNRTLRRSDKRNAALEGQPEHARVYQKRYSHVLTEYITDKNRAALANRAKR